MLSKITKIFALYLLSGACYASEAYGFPEELMYKGKPIDPSVMLGIQFYSAAEKVKVSDLDSDLIDGSKYEIILTFDPEANTVTKVYNSPQEHYEHGDVTHESYQYAGSYNGKHIIMSTLDSYSTMSRCCTSIDSIKREGDYITRIDSIGGGERAYGGMHQLDSFENGVLKYRYITPYREIIYLIDENSPCIDPLASLPEYPTSGGFWILEQVTISDFDNNFNKEICGIGLRDLHLYKAWQRHTYDDGTKGAERNKRNIAEFCFCEIAISYIESGIVDLIMDEVEEFASKVASCIEDKRDGV